MINRYYKKLWEYVYLETKGIYGLILRTLRFIGLVVESALENRVSGQAAALSYSTLMALGPLVAVLVMISSYVLQDEGAAFIAESLEKLLHFIAPSIENFPQQTTPTLPTNPTHGLNPDIFHFFEHIAQSARSGTMGIFGSLALLGIALLLIVSIEETLNTIWGVKQGRRWLERIVLYWTLLSLGALFGLASLTFFSLKTLAKFSHHLPEGIPLVQDQHFLLSSLSTLLTFSLLSLFYRLMPNTLVQWRPAFYGALLATLCLSINNRLSFLYINKALQSESLYGSIGIVPVLMFGLFIFWLFVLLGGQISYVAQNFQALSYGRMWQYASYRTHEALALTTFLSIARSFIKGQTAASIQSISKDLKIPAQTLNISIQRLIDSGWIHKIQSVKQTASHRNAYVPAYPLEKCSLLDFYKAFQGEGMRDTELLLEQIEPILSDYRKAFCCLDQESILNKSIYSLLSPGIQS